MRLRINLSESYLHMVFVLSKVLDLCNTLYKIRNPSELSRNLSQQARTRETNFHFKIVLLKFKNIFLQLVFTYKT